MSKRITIEPAQYGHGVSVYEWGRYPRGSVLAGQTRKQYVDGFDTVEQAQAAYPKADVSGYRESAYNTFDHLPDEDGTLAEAIHDPQP